MSSTADKLDAPTGNMVRRTVAVVDMIGYSTIAKLLEENISAQSVADLNHQIQLFMASSLAAIPDPSSYSVVAKTGDGIIVLFHHADDAHHFGCRVHLAARQHNDLRSERTAERWFRIGIATGNVHSTDAATAPSEYAGVTIANAVRLESAAQAGEIVIDRQSFEALAAGSKAAYTAETLVRGKRTERFPARRYCVTPHPDNTPIFRHRLITRRVLLGAAATLVGAAAFTTINPAFRPRFLEDIVQPLPTKRSVVVMAWPAAPDKDSFLSPILDNIRSHLTRAGSAFPNLFAVVADDKVDDRSMLIDVGTTILTPQLAAESWGANLILAAAVVSDRVSSYLTLHIVDAEKNSILRQDRLRIDRENPDFTARAASAKAARLLDLPDSEIVVSDATELGKLSWQDRELYERARLQAKDDDQEHVDRAKAAFEELTERFPHFALAHVELGNLFIGNFRRSHNEQWLRDANDEFSEAQSINGNSQRLKLGQAHLLLEKGQAREARTILSKELTSEPESPELLFELASACRQLHLIAEQVDIYRKIIQLHQYFWPAYNDLGQALHRQGNMDDALHSFKRASELAPRAVNPLVNISSVYLEMNRPGDAIPYLKRVAEITPKAEAFENLGSVSFLNKDYKGALASFEQASKIRPATHYFYADIADCYRMFPRTEGNRQAYTQAYSQNYTKAAELLSADLKVNPTDSSGWMTLALYEANLGHDEEADICIRAAERRGELDIESQFTKTRVLAALGRISEAKDLLAYCRTHGKTETDVQLATELSLITKT